MHFRILIMIVISVFLTPVECTKFVFGWGSAPDPAGEAYGTHPNPSCFKGALLLKRGKGRKRLEEGKKRETKGGQGKEGNGIGKERKYTHASINSCVRL